MLFDLPGKKFISYAQNFEDVLLWRVLKDVDCGSYVDVGALHPEELSVTKAFYDRGWRGINIEPDTKLIAEFDQRRERDVNLAIAVGADKAEVEFFKFHADGLHTTSKEVIDRYIQTMEEANNASWVPDVVKVPSQSLNTVLTKHPLPTIHFLKIDVEGSEKDVIASINLKIFRPWVILAESSTFVTGGAGHEEWEHLIIQHNYDFVYCDGINRYYLAKEQLHLRDRFEYPPNVLDNFISASEALLIAKVAELEEQLAEEE